MDRGRTSFSLRWRLPSPRFVPTLFSSHLSGVRGSLGGGRFRLHVPRDLHALGSAHVSLPGPCRGGDRVPRGCGGGHRVWCSSGLDEKCRVERERPRWIHPIRSPRGGGTGRPETQAEGRPFEPRKRGGKSERETSGMRGGWEPMVSRMRSSTVVRLDRSFGWGGCAIGHPRSFQGSRESPHPAPDLLLHPRSPWSQPSSTLRKRDKGSGVNDRPHPPTWVPTRVPDPSRPDSHQSEPRVENPPHQPSIREANELSPFHTNEWNGWERQPTGTPTHTGRWTRCRMGKEAYIKGQKQPTKAHE